MEGNELTLQEASDIINTVQVFHLGAEKVLRYSKNPYVEGDNLAEHLSRMARLAVYAMPFFLVEFKNEPSLAQDIYTTVITHDDDEIACGFDVVTFLKNHNSKDQEEIDSIRAKMGSLPPLSVDYVLNKFSSFRKKDTLAARITKVFDNVTGNQLVIEQKLGIVAPDLAKFTFNYAEKTKGVSKTTDSIIDAQLKQIIDYRSFAKDNESELDILIEKSLKQEGCELSDGELKIIIKKLLEVDILSHELDSSKISFNIWQYK
jgi:5'-deoxynucleotidase YfbR-like HD superfamily hydrolase